MLIQLAEHEVEVGLLRELLQRVRRLDDPQVGRGGVEVALGRGEDDLAEVFGLEGSGFLQEYITYYSALLISFL